ncbi:MULTISPECIES: c-type cytochrome [unclassified Carboxylicivirga]|uniref:c-type cytochrome n=1 Tax=Carboxylicivirga TaxID=1628153 RepID=UPI003D34566D
MHKLIGASLLVVGLVACGPSGNKKSAEKQASNPVETPITLDEHPGKQAYLRHCMACHQRNANGLPGMYPPLANNKMVSGDPSPLIDIVLNGMSGEIEVNGQKYNGVMASYRNLSDQEIADILNYLRTGFGNEGAEIVASDVKALR